jgi:hypothetical protein
MGQATERQIQNGVELVSCRHLAISSPTIADGNNPSRWGATQEPGEVAIYARVSSRDQKADLDRQASFAIEHRSLGERRGYRGRFWTGAASD